MTKVKLLVTEEEKNYYMDRAEAWAAEPDGAYLCLVGVRDRTDVTVAGSGAKLLHMLHVGIKELAKAADTDYMNVLNALEQMNDLEVNGSVKALVEYEKKARA